MHLQPVFSSAEMHGGKVSERLFDHGLCLPSGSAMSEAERNRVIAGVLACFAR
jgi:dTDP-4-amino-4,6-dideoxygalactose transaminase